MVLDRNDFNMDTKQDSKLPLGSLHCAVQWMRGWVMSLDDCSLAVTDTSPLWEQRFAVSNL